MSAARQGANHAVLWHEVAMCVLLMGGCNGACTACAPPRQHIGEQFALMMMGPFAGRALEDRYRLTWPGLVFATFTTIAPGGMCFAGVFSI